MLLCLGSGFLVIALTAALLGLGVESEESAFAANLGAYIFLGLAVLSLGLGVLTRRWERTSRDRVARRSGLKHRRWTMAPPDRTPQSHTEGEALRYEV
jgi:hypothetical protein